MGKLIFAELLWIEYDIVSPQKAIGCFFSAPVGEKAWK